jgi:L-alanine-DL-glutamate epimerase-like enolase superfamily enzyme
MLKLPIRLTVMVLLNRASAVRALLAHGLGRRRDAGAVDQAHQLAHGQGRGHGGLAVGFLADVALDELAADLRRHGLAALDLQVGDHDLAAVGRQHARRAFTQARSAAGDDECLACDVHGAVSCLVQAPSAR